MSRRLGISLLEMLLVLALLAIVAGLAWRFLGAEEASRGAAALARHTARGRAVALVEGRSVAISACPGHAVLPVELGPGLRLSWPARGLVFGADGLPRSCAGGLGNGTVLVEDRRGGVAAVLVSSLGRVRWEPR